MNPSHQAIAEFWSWFQLHQRDFDALIETDAPFWDIAVTQLQRLDSRLWFELSHPEGTEREFIITAQGVRAAFPIAESIVAHAPSIPGWRFIALKPPMGFDFETAYEGISFDPASMRFVPLENAARPQDIGIRVAIPNYSLAIKRQCLNAVLIILDTALGERAAANDIQYLDVSVLPEGPAAARYLELKELPAYIERRKQKFRNP